MSLTRKHAAQLGHETRQILEQGRYTNEKGEVVEIATLLDRAVRGTCSYPPECPLPQFNASVKDTQIEVRNETTLNAARRLLEGGHRPAALNCASARHPGGGFLSGARAQEESLARSSGIYACLTGNPMYDRHSALGDPMYTDYAIYSPEVPVFRKDDGTLLEQPYLWAFITSPAVNAKVVLERDRSAGPRIREAMAGRIAKVLSIAAIHQHDALVLGAWGCGVFGNDCAEVADLFHEALFGRFRGIFARVIFAVVDWSVERRFIGPFEERFGLPGA
jgi:uncharacterized protein (TIGR02452 family)